jgi:hypothetical protein
MFGVPVLYKAQQGPGGTTRKLTASEMSRKLGGQCPLVYFQSYYIIGWFQRDKVHQRPRHRPTTARCPIIPQGDPGGKTHGPFWPPKSHRT